MNTADVPGQHLISDIVWRVVDETGSTNIRTVADEVECELDRLVESGEAWAEAALRRCQSDGIWRVVQRIIKAEQTVIFVPADKAPVTTAARYPVAERDEQGNPTKVRQMSLWFAIPWDDLMAIAQEIARKAEPLNRRARAFNEVLKLRDRYPETRTAGEACKLAGIDPAQFRLDEEAS